MRRCVDTHSLVRERPWHGLPTSLALLGLLALTTRGHAQDRPPIDAPQPYLFLERTSLTSGKATGHPDGGSFTYDTKVAAGTTVGTLSSPNPDQNPNVLQLPDPPNPSPKGSPSPGGLGQYTVVYDVNGMSVTNHKDDPFHIPTFGMSCYDSALESDYGTIQHCAKGGTKKHPVSGTVTDPTGYPGTYCAAFIYQLELQGSGKLTSGQKLQYISKKIQNVDQITTHDGTHVEVDRTLARALSVIPSRGVRMDVDQIGKDLPADDTGGDIAGYRLDIYKGFGQRACAGFHNVMAVSACSPGSKTCPPYSFP